MKVIELEAEVVADHIAHVRLPASVPCGRVRMVVVVEEPQVEASDAARREEARKDAVRALIGSMRDTGGSVEEFLALKREDNRREAERDERRLRS